MLADPRPSCSVVMNQVRKLAKVSRLEDAIFQEVEQKGIHAWALRQAPKHANHSVEIGTTIREAESLTLA